MKKLILTSLCLLMVLVLPALAAPVNVYSVDGPQDPLFLQDWVEEFGDEDYFPDGEQIISQWWETEETACTAEPYDDPDIPNVMVEIVNLTNKTVPLYYVGNTYWEPQIPPLPIISLHLATTMDSLVTQAGMTQDMPSGLTMLELTNRCGTRV